MSNFQNPYQKISWLERRLNALESRLSALLNGASLRSTGGGATTTGVLEVHKHTGTGEGGTLDYKGTGTITAAATSVTITHGVGATPTIQQITVTPSNNPTNDPGHMWVDTIGATTFAVNCRAVPGASTLTFGWRVSPT